MSHPRSDTWKSIVRACLELGLGVEDAAVLLSKNDIPTTADEVRGEVSRLRASGELKDIYRRQG